MSQPQTPEEKAAAQLDDSARRTIASWIGDLRATALIAELRPKFRQTLESLGVEGPVEQVLAARRILGIRASLPGGDEEPNPFAAWPEERLAPARLIASAVRADVVLLVARLRALGVTAVPRVEQVPKDEETPDGLRFDYRHVALSLLLWLDIPLENRTGTEIVDDLPMLGTVGWVEGGSELLVGDASHPDILAGAILRQAHLIPKVGSDRELPAPDEMSRTLPLDAEVHDYLEANPPRMTDTYGLSRGDRYRTPGWSDLAEFFHEQTEQRRQAGRPRSGRPPGSGWLIKDRAELLERYRQLRQRAGRRPSQVEFAQANGMGTRTVRHYLVRFGMRWPPE